MGELVVSDSPASEFLASGAPLERDARVSVDPSLRLVGDHFVLGGSPPRLWHLPGAARLVLERWRDSGVVSASEGHFARNLVAQGLVRWRRATNLGGDEIDVIIPVRESYELLAQRLIEWSDWPVVVVDDASSDPARIATLCESAGAHLVRLDRRHGPGGARNAGLRASSRPFVCLLDVDVTVDEARETLGRLVASLRDEAVGAVAPRVRGAAGPRWRDGFELRHSPLDQGPRSGLVRPGSPVGFVPSALLVAKRSALAEGYDESLLVGEDVDLVWRLHDEGWLVIYDADVTVTHRARESWRDWWRQRVSYGASSAPLALRHGDRLAPIRLDLLSVLAWGGLLSGRPFLARWVLRVGQTRVAAQLPATATRVDQVARDLVTRSFLRGAGPLARALVRTYGPALVLLALHPRWRRRAIVVALAGTLWRWRHRRFVLSDVPLAVADDLAYATGVVSGAWRTKTWRGLQPSLVTTSLRLRDFFPLTQSSRAPHSL